MPTLAQTRDGSFFIRHYFHGHSTWQVLAKGVHLLRRRSVTVDSRFSTDLFMHLWALGLIYHGDTRPKQSGALPDAVAGELLEQVRECHAALGRRDVERARLFATSEDVASTLMQLFGSRAAVPPRWSVEPPLVTNLDSASQSRLEAVRLAEVYVALSELAGADPHIQGVKECWLQKFSGSWICVLVEVDRQDVS